MFVTLLVWGYLLGLGFVYGQALLRFWGWRRGWGAAIQVVHPALQVLLGLVALTVAGMFFSLFMPLGWQVNLLFLLGALGLSLVAFRKGWVSVGGLKAVFSGHRLSGWLALVLLAAVVFALDKSTGRATNPDTLGYHIQTIRWVESYPVVPGLGNLHGRLAFNSSWLLLNAQFSFVYVFGQSLRVMAGFLFVLLGLYFVGGLAAFFERGSLAGLLRAALLPVVVYTFKSELSSPGTDLPAVLLAWTVLALFVQALELDGARRQVLLGLAFFFALFAVTVKLSVAPLGLVAVLVLALNWRDGRFVASLLAGALVLFAPWLARNVILSGYLLFPFPALDLFAFDWKISAEQVRGFQHDVLAFGRIPNLPVPVVMEMGFSEWFPLWWERVTLVRKGLFLAALVSPLLVIPRWWVGARPAWTVLGLFASFYLGFLYWFFSAPDFRFGFGFIFAVLLLVAWLWLALIRWSLVMRALGVGLAVFALVYPAALMAVSLDVDALRARAFMPGDYESPPVDTCLVGDRQIYCSRIYGWCGYETFPCALKVRLGTELRGEDWRDGFRDARP